MLAEAAGDGSAFVLATAAAGQRPDLAVRHAVEWFGGLGLRVEELPATTRELAESPEIAARAREGRFFYLVGGDPRLVPATLSDTPVWEAIVNAWRGGAALAGASAGAMALCEWTLLPDQGGRAYAPGLNLVPRSVILPHFDTFGASWAEAAVGDAPDDDVVLIGPDERSAAIWHDGVWRALGDGGVTVIADGSRQRYEPGEVVAGLSEPTA